MTAEELLNTAFKKIGILSVENDLLRDQLNDARREIERLTPKPLDSNSEATEESPRE